MKKILSFLVAVTLMLLPAAGQQNLEKLKKLETMEQQAREVTPPDTLVLEEEDVIMASEESATGDSSVLTTGNAAVNVEDKGDETIIRIGNKGIRISNMDDEAYYDDFHDNDRKTNRRSNFSGHLGGIELGYNNYMTDFWTTSLEPADNYFDLNTSRSTVFNMISPNVSLGFTRHFGLVTSLGISFNNYRFDNDNSITVDADGVVIPYYPLADDIKKSKLATVYAILPVIIEAQIPVSRGTAINIGAGVVGAVKLGSHTKIVYYDNGKQKTKNRDDFSLNLLRYGVTGRLGYEMIQLYGTCYLSSMFEKNKAPELYPFEIGIALTIND